MKLKSTDKWPPGTTYLSSTPVEQNKSGSPTVYLTACSNTQDVLKIRREVSTCKVSQRLLFFTFQMHLEHTQD